MNRALPTCALVLAAAVFTLSGPLASAGPNLYRWTDEQGNQVNSDRPPPTGIDYEVISTSSSMVRSVNAEEGAVPAKVKPSPGNDFDPVNTSKPMIEKNPEYCQRAKDNLAALDAHVKIQMRDDQGEIHDLSDEEREIQRHKAMDTIKANCE